MIRDRNIEWLRTRKVIPYSQFGFSPTFAATGHTHEYSTHTGTGTTASGSAAGSGFVGMDDGAPVVGEISSFGIGGIQIAAAGDKMSVCLLDLLPDIDVAQEIGVRVLWVNNGVVATSDSVTWLVTYDQVDVGEAMAAASTALDTVIAAQSPSATTTLILKKTSRGIINAATFDNTARAGGITFSVEADVLSGFSANEVVFLGLEIDYIPRRAASAYEGVDVFKVLAAAG